jgi:hypothetical protein
MHWERAHCPPAYMYDEYDLGKSFTLTPECKERVNTV